MTAARFYFALAAGLLAAGLTFAAFWLLWAVYKAA